MRHRLTHPFSLPGLAIALTICAIVGWALWHVLPAVLFTGAAVGAWWSWWEREDRKR